jgi:hypothetical protein
MITRPKIMNPELYHDEPLEFEPLTESQQAQKWYQLAALSEGNSTQASLTKIYNENADAQWYVDAANSGDKYAQYALGKIYYNGILTNSNLIKSAMWFSKASANGIPFADYELAKMCAMGIGLEKDPTMSGELYQKAFKAFIQQEQKTPNVNIELKLATIYENGLAGNKDLNLANYWRGIADTNRQDYLPEAVAEKTLSRTVSPSPQPEDEKTIKPINQNKSEKSKLITPVLNWAERRKNKKDAPRNNKDKGTASKNAQNIKGIEIKEFLDMVMPSVLDFHRDYFVCGNTYRSVWAIREYPTVTESTALLRQLGEMDGVTLRIYTRPVTPYEENKVLEHAERKNKSSITNSRSIRATVAATENLTDVATLASQQHKTKQSLIHCAVFIELIGNSYKDLTELKQRVISFFARSKITYDKLELMQKEGFQSVMLTGSNQFKSQFERILPSSSVANLYPFSYSGKTDSDGMFIGRDVNGSNIIVNFDRRSRDKTNGHILILGNTGEGKSHLLKLIITNFRQMGKKFFILDPDDEYKDLTIKLKGCYIDMMAGIYCINVLEPRLWTVDPKEDEQESAHEDIPQAFRKGTRLSQHIAYLRDFFKCYKQFPTDQLDTLEILLERLYRKFNITDDTDFSTMQPDDYPILSDLFEVAQAELDSYDNNGNQLYTKDILRTLTLGLRSICVGNESTYFNGHTNITNADFIDFSVKGMLETNENLKNAMFMNIFSYMSHKFLTEGEAEIAIDELHLFLSNKIAIDYIRSFSKRGRKKDSGIILASQNVEDFLLPGVIEYTKPLLSIPTHSFLFHPGGNCDVKDFQRALSVKECEYKLIEEPSQGFCLYKCGRERYHLHVIAPDYKVALFGTVGGR